VIKLQIKELSGLLGVQYQGDDVQFAGVATDSREVMPGNLFVTWTGESLDGHQFCPKAVEQGAVALLVEKKVDIDVPQIIVKDAIKALGTLAAFWRQQFDLPFVAVTGSNGKTTVKNMLSAIFSCLYGDDYLAPIKSYNNHTGVPLTLSRLSKQHKAAVLEMGMDHFGELSYLTQLVKPQIALITNASFSHLEDIGSVADVAKAKAEIFEGLPDDGIAVLNADDAFFDYWKSGLKNKTVLSFGIQNKADVYATDIVATRQGIQFLLHTPTDKIKVQSVLLGEHNVMNALAAAALAYALNVTPAIIAEGLAKVQPEPRRLNLKKTKADAILIDDSYNANPASMKKAIDVLVQFQGEKILVLSDMKALGKDERLLHREIGEYAKARGVNAVYAVGDLMAELVRAFGDNAQHFCDKSALRTALQALDAPGKVFLIKGSNSQKMNEEVSLMQGTQT
jgi:UDP-N-acetylmuramoyl-tripeptide--D-alanyl-D-alanine ligase